MNNDINDTLIAELICTRISHDLIGNIGAVANAVELLEEGDMDFLDDIKSILKVSSSVLSARQKFFRMAFGLGNANLENMPLVRKTTEEYLATLGNRNFPIELQMAVQDPKFSRPAMVGTMVLADTIIKGGWIKIEERNGKLYIGSHSDAEPSKEKTSALRNICEGKDCEISAQFAPVFYLKKILNFAGYNLAFIEDGVLGLVMG